MTLVLWRIYFLFLYLCGYLCVLPLHRTKHHTISLSYIETQSVIVMQRFRLKIEQLK